MDWASVDWNAFGAGLLVFVIGLLSYLGKRQGERQQTTTAARVSTTPLTEIAGALVDSSSLNKHTASVEALNLTMMAGQVNNKELTRAIVEALNSFTKNLHETNRGLEQVREEMEEVRKEVHEQFMLKLMAGRNRET